MNWDLAYNHPYCIYADKPMNWLWTAYVLWRVQLKADPWRNCWSDV